MMHAHDRLIRQGQQRVATVCGLRVAVGHSVIITKYEHKYLEQGLQHYDCVGCISVITERGKEQKRS